MTAQLIERLRAHLLCEIELVVNENRSTLLNLLEKSRKKVRLSLHKLFLDAPDSVVAALAGYVRGERKVRSVLRAYIQQNHSQFPTTYPGELIAKGREHDLIPLFHELNHAYFKGSIEVCITWYGAWGHKNRSRVTFGQYLETSRLIKIHRILDDPFVPPLFLSYVLFHEMLHVVIPGQIDAKGRLCLHGSEFKNRERTFAHYEEAIRWERENKGYFFR